MIKITKRLSVNEIEEYLINNHNLTIFLGMNDYEGTKEDRNGLIYNIYKNKNLHHNLISIKRENDSYYLLEENFNKNNNNKLKWDNLNSFFKEYLSNKKTKTKTILFDITDLDLDTLIHIIPLVLDYKIIYIYTIPEKYSSANFTIKTKKISQPQGYCLINTKNNYLSSHIILLGLDELRAYKFILNYGWAIDKLKLISVKDNVDNCESRLINANNFLNNQFKPNQFIEINLLNYDEIIQIIEEELLKNDSIDIIPLGPQPVIFNILLYYFENYNTLKDKVRFLYDFQTKLDNRTQGIKEICFSEINFK